MTVTKLLVLAAALTVGMAGGTTGTLSLQDDASRSPSMTGAPSVGVNDSVELGQRVAGDRVLLAWTPGGLPPGLDAAVAGLAGVKQAVVVRGDPVDLRRSIDANGLVVDEPTAGWFIPLDAVAFDPTRYAAVAPAADRAKFVAVGPGEALLGETSARLRRLGPGGQLELAGGDTVSVAGVVPDETIGGAELAVDLATGERLGVATPRALLVAYAGDRAAFEAAIAQAVPAGTPVRFRAPGETPFLRAGDAVLPQIVLKDLFGEFSYRPGATDQRDVELDPAWVADNIGAAEVPVVGRVRCHRAVLDTLAGMMGEVEAAGLAATIRTFDGCWVPRLVRPGAALSHHAWGVAIDVNFADNPTSVRSLQDPRLVEIFERWGFAWGGTWLIPDPAHFEYLRPRLPDPFSECAAVTCGIRQVGAAHSERGFRT
ncbi:MAG: M15 family metallopeptidase [Acidimicrobiales bacterium]